MENLLSIAAEAEERGNSEAAALIRQAALEINAVKGEPGKMKPALNKRFGDMGEFLDNLGDTTYKELLAAVKATMLDTLRDKKKEIVDHVKDEFGNVGVKKAMPILDDWYMGIVKDVFAEGLPAVRSAVEQVFEMPIPGTKEETESEEEEGNWEDEGEYEDEDVKEEDDKEDKEEPEEEDEESDEEEEEPDDKEKEEKPKKKKKGKKEKKEEGEEEDKKEASFIQMIDASIDAEGADFDELAARITAAASEKHPDPKRKAAALNLLIDASIDADGEEFDGLMALVEGQVTRPFEIEAGPGVRSMMEHVIADLDKRYQRTWNSYKDDNDIETKRELAKIVTQIESMRDRLTHASDEEMNDAWRNDFYREAKGIKHQLSFYKGKQSDTVTTALIIMAVLAAGAAVTYAILKYLMKVAPETATKLKAHIVDLQTKFGWRPGKKLSPTAKKYTLSFAKSLDASDQKALLHARKATKK